MSLLQKIENAMHPERNETVQLANPNPSANPRRAPGTIGGRNQANNNVHVDGPAFNDSGSAPGSYVPGQQTTYAETEQAPYHGVPPRGAAATSYDGQSNYRHEGPGRQQAPSTTGGQQAGNMRTPYAYPENRGNLPGPAPMTAGPHRLDVLNILDPRVDHNPQNPNMYRSQASAPEGDFDRPGNPAGRGGAAQTPAGGFGQQTAGYGQQQQQQREHRAGHGIQGPQGPGAMGPGQPQRQEANRFEGAGYGESAEMYDGAGQHGRGRGFGPGATGPSARGDFRADAASRIPTGPRAHANQGLAAEEGIPAGGYRESNYPTSNEFSSNGPAGGYRESNYPVNDGHSNGPARTDAAWDSGPGARREFDNQPTNNPGYRYA